MTRSAVRVQAPIIEVTKLTKKFGDFTAVDNISFTVPKAAIYAFLGPNGAGKTTTIKMLTTLLKQDSGSVRIDGLDPVKDANAVRQRFGIVFQDPSSDDELTAEENLLLHAALYNVPRAVANKRIDEVLELVELSDRKKSIVKTFSGGMKRRLEIARSLLHTPKVIFLDEPTVGLDPQTRNKMWDYLVALNKREGVTILFTTHYMEEADKVADHVAIIDHGKILLQSTPADVKKKTKTKTLEEAFLKLTGRAIRAEEANALDNLRAARKMWKR